MKKFQFSLDKVLEVKEIEEKILQKDLLLIQHEILKKENNILDLEEKISQECITLSVLSQEITQSSKIMLHYQYIESLQKKIDFLIHEITELRSREEKVKNMLIIKSKEKKSLEHLKEIKYDEFKKEYKKHEQTILDEVSIQNHRFKQDSNK
ncbi:MAG TPA: flagellar export protein FliJ [Candidatus Cloacimonadota bacterium]|nr:flagellar export protein FliJ [Candidatus Cloacimonadota bacterium]